MNELLELLEHSGNWPQAHSFFVTTLHTLAKKLEQRGRVYVVGECNRQHVLQSFAVIIRSLRIMIAEHPDAVITTGSLPLALACLCAKLVGAKIVWIDSIANIERFSLSGRMIQPFADLFLTQWPELAQRYRNVEYAGSII